MPARSVDQVVNVCKTRGFVFPGSAAYGGLGSFWDYGPLGVEMLNNVKQAWWRDTVHKRDDVEGLDAAILMARKVWQHSGHEATFSDPLVDNKKNNRRYRLDHLLQAQSTDTLDAICDILKPAPTFTAPSRQASISPDAETLAGLLVYHYRAVQAHYAASEGQVRSENQAILMDVFGLTSEEASMASRGAFRPDPRMFEPEQRDPLTAAAVIDPNDGEPGLWTAPRQFNLMFVTHVGPVAAESGTEEELGARVYLRPETAQGIFLNFKNVQRSMARRIPFGIAQIGKAFRNEITPGNFIFRTREFEQMEIEFFVKPPQYVTEGEKTDEQWHEDWIERRHDWWVTRGIDASRIRKREQTKQELAHYSKRTVDLEYLFPGALGWGEIEGVANRTDYDLTAHSKDVPDEDLRRLKLEPNTDSVEKFDYFDPEAKARYIPWVIEPSAGATRAMLAFLCEAYDEELVKEPPQAEVEAIAAEIPAVIKNAQKKVKAADKADSQAGPEGAAPKHDATSINDFCEKLEDAAKRLPQSLLEIDALLAEHAGAQNLEPVKKLKPKVNKLAEDCARVVLRLKPELAPIKLAVFPLKKNKPELVDIARKLKQTFQQHFRTVYDDSAGIGRLYRRQDEIGTPWCITVDFQTLEDNTVTVRERDTMQQTRVAMKDLREYFTSRMGG